MKDLIRKNYFFRHIAAFTLLAFVSLSVIPSQALAQGVLLGLPQPGTMISLSPAFNPALLRGLQVYPDNPLRFDFIVDPGDTGLQGQAFKDEATKLIKYFLASLTIPEDDFWVNLSPYEKERIIADALGQTEMGRDLLAQDYILKQLAATLVNPENDLGKKFWDRVYKKSYELYGTTNVPADTFNKVWIMPDKAVVYEHNAYAFVGERHLKVMLEEDYLAIESNKGVKDYRGKGLQESQSQEFKKSSSAEDGSASGGNPLILKPSNPSDKLTSQIVREVLIPEIEKEVNNGKVFANLRQIVNSMILATWYKKTLKDSLLGQVYADKNKIKGLQGQRITGIKESQSQESEKSSFAEDGSASGGNPSTLESSDSQSDVQSIYNQYLETFKKGVFNFIRVEKDVASGKNIPRKYFSGGISKGVSTPEKLVAEKKDAKAITAFLLSATSGVKMGVFKTDLGEKPGSLTSQPAKIAGSKIVNIKETVEEFLLKDLTVELHFSIDVQRVGDDAVVTISQTNQHVAPLLPMTVNANLQSLANKFSSGTYVFPMAPDSSYTVKFKISTAGSIMTTEAILKDNVHRLIQGLETVVGGKARTIMFEKAIPGKQ
ncbi:MAG: hypothetical protein NT079_02765, partial [Candidatus Omnitrophica bacterium]|nr:hypothetical protein [Candidatus Omnitrophota bacterium]